MSPFTDYRGEVDMNGYQLSVTNIAVADVLASAAARAVVVLLSIVIKYAYDASNMAERLSNPEPPQ